jgi:hypothetical protein
MKKQKDYDQLAAVEKAIAEKYGKTAAQDIRGDWNDVKEKEYLEQIKNRSLKTRGAQKRTTEIAENTFISEKVNHRKQDNTCPVCKTYSFSMKDDLYMNRFSCCYDCYIDFVADREDRWKDGWRPDKERIELAVKRRK